MKWCHIVAGCCNTDSVKKTWDCGSKPASFTEEKKRLWSSALELKHKREDLINDAAAMMIVNDLEHLYLMM